MATDIDTVGMGNYYLYSYRKNFSLGIKLLFVRPLKLLLISLVVIFLIATGISLMIPSHISISKAINIHGQRDSILALIKDRGQWTRWHPAYIPNDSTPKFDSIHIVSMQQSDSEIVMFLQQSNKEVVTNGWRVYQHENVDSLTLQWYMKFNLKWYPWKKFGSLLYESTYGVMMQEGLTNVKSIVESE
jgi:hypothetical protein